MIKLNNYSTIMAEHEKETLSDKYRFVPTIQVANVLQDHGWFPVKVQEQRVLSEEKKGFQKHLIRFRQEGNGLNQIDKVFPEIVLTNSHDGLAAFSLMAGLFRLICLNGAVIAESTFSSHRIKHIGYTNEKVKLAIEDMQDNIPRIVGKVNDYRQIELTKDEQGIFALTALNFEYDTEFRMDTDSRGSMFARGEDMTLSISELLRPNRREDAVPNLWNTYNTVQERIMKGKVHVEKAGSFRKAKKVTSITEDIRINKALWRMADEMAKLKGAN